MTGYYDTDFTKRLYESKNDTQWRAAKELDRLSEELDEKGQTIYAFRMALGKLGDILPDLFPYPSYPYSHGTTVEEIRGCIDRYHTKIKKELDEK
jgi:hypothetical protein